LLLVVAVAAAVAVAASNRAANDNMITFAIRRPSSTGTVSSSSEWKWAIHRQFDRIFVQSHDRSYHP
jgi:hypothetical protein